MADAKTLKQLTIKTNVVKRLVKEAESYKKEGEKEKEKIKGMEEKDPNAYELKKMKEVYNVSLLKVFVLFLGRCGMNKVVYVWMGFGDKFPPFFTLSSVEKREEIYHHC